MTFLHQIVTEKPKEPCGLLTEPHRELRTNTVNAHKNILGFVIISNKSNLRVIVLKYFSIHFVAEVTFFFLLGIFQMEAT